MPSAHRIWWLIAFCALGIGLAIEADAPAASSASTGSAVATPAAATSLVAVQRAGRRA
jgi:hypothetical protein